MLNQIPSIDDAVQSIIDEFSLFDDWIERYEYIIELGEKLSGLSEAQKTEANRVRGCQSQVWFVATRVEDRVHFDADSDAMIVRGLIALLLRVYSDRTLKKSLQPPDFFEAVDLGSHLSGNRANGLAAMINHIRSFAESSTQ